MHFTPSKFGDVSKLVPQISKTAIILYNNDVNVPLMVCHIFAIDLLKKWLFFFFFFFFFFSLSVQNDIAFGWDSGKILADVDGRAHEHCCNT